MRMMGKYRLYGVGIAMLVFVIVSLVKCMGGK